MHECFCTHWNNENLAMLTFSVGVIKCRSFLAALFSPYSGTKFMLVMLHRLMSTEHMWKSNNLGKKGGGRSSEAELGLRGCQRSGSTWMNIFSALFAPKPVYFWLCRSPKIGTKLLSKRLLQNGYNYRDHIFQLERAC